MSERVKLLLLIAAVLVLVLMALNYGQVTQ